MNLGLSQNPVDDRAINSLPAELLAEVLFRVASASFTDLFNSEYCCREFRGVVEDDYFLRQVSVETFPVIHQWLKSERVNLFLSRCRESGNPEALYRQGMVEYFSSMRTEPGLENLKRAAEKGHVEASYVYGIILLCMGGQASLRGLNILNAITKTSTTTTSQSSGDSRAFRECRERVKTVLRSMWVNNHLVGHQRRNCSHQPGRVKETWEGRFEEGNDTNCESCKWDREAKLFCDMLR